MQMDEGMDTGDILAVQKVTIGETETAEQLFERLAVVSAQLTAKTVELIENGEVTPVKQNETEATYAPILKKEMALLDFTKSAEELYNAVRGYYSWPCAFFFLDGKRIKVIESRIGGKTSAKAGTVANNENELEIACGDGMTLRLLTVQPEGSKAMTSKQMLLGNKIAVGKKVGE